MSTYRKSFGGYDKKLHKLELLNLSSGFLVICLSSGKATLKCWTVCLFYTFIVIILLKYTLLVLFVKKKGFRWPKSMVFIC